MYQGGVSILQYADDTIIFMEHDFDKAMNMKLILSFFEQLSGLKIKIITTAKFISFVRQKKQKMNIQIYLDVRRAHFH
jgi:predicted house-cleaning NTP pyrophosphatase (Maf/HAM1 superfamily)